MSRCSRVLPKLCTVFSGVTKCTFRWGCVSRPSPNTNPPCDLLLVRSRWYTNHYVHFWGVMLSEGESCGLWLPSTLDGVAQHWDSHPCSCATVRGSWSRAGCPRRRRRRRHRRRHRRPPSPPLSPLPPHCLPPSSCGAFAEISDGSCFHFFTCMSSTQDSTDSIVYVQCS